MNTLDNVNTKEEINTAYPARPVSESLRARIAHLTQAGDARRAQQQQKRRVVRRTLALSGALAGVALLALATPRLSLAYTLGKMAQAMEGAESAHATIQITLPDGTTRKHGEYWYAKGQWRMQDGPRTNMQRGGKTYHWSEGENVVHLQSTQANTMKSSGFTVAALIRDAAQNTWMGKPEILGQQTVQGRVAEVVAFTTFAKERLVFYADPTTHLPFLMEVTNLRDNNPGAPVMTYKMEYNLPVPAEKFALPQGKIVDDDKAQEETIKRLEKGVTQIANSNTTIRAIEVNKKGDVFVFYTEPAQQDSSDRLQDSIQQVTDNQQGTYLLHPENLIVRPGTKQMAKQPEFRATQIQGQRLQGHRFTHIDNRGKNTYPRNLTFYLTSGKTQTVTIPSPTCDATPEIASYIPLSSAEDIEGTRLRIQGHAYIGNNDVKALELLEESLHVTDKYYQSKGYVLPFSLRKETYKAMAGCLKRLGRDAEAAQMEAQMESRVTP
jgi:outer membrane lipoprotein-sorting protein